MIQQLGKAITLGLRQAAAPAVARCGAPRAMWGMASQLPPPLLLARRQGSRHSSRHHSRRHSSSKGPPTDTRLVGSQDDEGADDDTRAAIVGKLKGSAGRGDAELPTQAQALVEDRRKRAFVRACHEGDASVVAAFVAAGGDVADERMPVYPLHIAVLRGDAELAALLLAHGADADFYAGVKEAGPAALHLAAERGDAPMLRLLLEAGADADLSATKFEATALHFAAGLGHADAVAALVEAGANTAALTTTGATPAQVAEEGGHSAAIAPLLEQ